MTQLLQYTQVGQGEPLLILHGLFGSSKNWQSLAKQFAEHFTVYALDLRNHGSSFHDPLMNYEAMAEDVSALIKHLAIEHCHMIGHSMGGKTAMLLVQKSPQIVADLIVADIAPVVYQHSNSHIKLIESILTVKLTEISSRSDVDRALKADIPDPMLRGFLLQNLIRDSDVWRWKVNWQAIQQQMHELVGFPLDATDWQIDIPTLFIRGENSEYIDAKGISTIHQHFSKASVETIERAGHWLHAEQPRRFVDSVLRFLL